jgi:hypothetical protein
MPFSVRLMAIGVLSHRRWWRPVSGVNAQRA